MILKNNNQFDDEWPGWPASQSGAAPQLEEEAIVPSAVNEDASKSPEKTSASRRKPLPDTKGTYCYAYPHAAIAADCVLFGFNGKSLEILLIERGNEPFKGYWALPGGFMRIDETIEETAARELEEETNIHNVYLEQFKVYSTVKRDPRERVVSIAFIALVRPQDYEVIAGDDAAKAKWFDEAALPPLAFDHALIIREAREYLKELLYHKPVAFELLNKTFTMSQLQTVYEVINQAVYDRRNFLRTALDSEVIVEADEAAQKESGRSVKLYQRYNDPDEEDSPVPDYQRFPAPPQEITLDFEDNSRSIPEERTRQDSSKGHLSESIISNFCYHPIPPAPSKARRSAPTKGLFDFLRRKR